MSATPEQRTAWQAMQGFAKREVGGKLQIGRYQIRTDSIDWFDFPLSRPPTIASNEPAGVVAVPVMLAELHAPSPAPIKKRASRAKKSNI